MEKEFIPYTQALALKELGFDEDVFEWFDAETKDFCDVMKEVKAPLYQQAFRWFREKYVMCSFIQRFEGGVYDYEITSEIFKEITDFKDGYFKTYEEAELACLKKLIEIVQTH